MKFKFYVVIVVAILGLLGNAIWQTSVVQNGTEAAALERHETLSYRECVSRFRGLRGILSSSPKTWREYYTNVGNAYALIGAAQKAMQDAPIAVPQADRDTIYVVRDIPIQVPTLLSEYQGATDQALFATRGGSEWKAAYDEFERSGMDPLTSPSTPVSGGGRLGFWWAMFQLGSMPFVFLHYCMRIRKNGMKVRFELLGNPAFPLWLLFWEIGIFRYPREISVLKQLRRVQQWAAFVLSSAIPCLAAGAGGTGCEKKPTPVRWSFDTSTMSSYPGLEGAVFFPYAVQQSSLTATERCGVYANVWDSEPLGHRKLEPNYGREVDLTLGWSGPVKGISLDLHATYLGVSPLLKLPAGDVFQLSQRASRSFALSKHDSVAPYVWFREMTPIRGSTPIGGWFVHGGATFSDSFGKSFSSDASFEMLHDSGAVGYNPGYIGRFLETMSWKPGKHFSLRVPFIATTPLSHTGDKRKTHFTSGLTLSFSY